MFFIEDSNFLTDQHKECIEHIRKDDFPYFYQSDCVEDDENIFLSHVLILRPEERINNQIYNSEFSEVFEDMLITFCNKNQVEHNETLRASINLTFNNGQDKCLPHTDHKYYYKHLLIYLNDPVDNKSHTVILDADEKHQLKRIVPEKYKGVCFENLPHYQIYPKFGDRRVGVFTFK